MIAQLVGNLPGHEIVGNRMAEQRHPEVGRAVESRRSVRWAANRADAAQHRSQATT